MQFAIGDVVSLKSGGMKMTVTFRHEDGDLACTWFLGGEVKSANFPPDALDKH